MSITVIMPDTDHVYTYEPAPPTKTIHYVRRMGYWQAFIGDKAVATRLSLAGLEKALRGLGLSPKGFQII